MRKGFSLIELMIVVSVSTVIFVAVGSSFITAQRMLKTAMAEAELSLAGRELRDKFLFRLGPTVNGVHYGGIYGGTSTFSTLLEGGLSSNLEFYSPSIRDNLGSISPWRVRIIMWQTGSEHHFINEGIPDKDRHKNWLYPSHVALADSKMSDIVDTSIMRTYGEPLVTMDFTLKAGVKNLDGSPILRREHVTAVSFSEVQPLTYTYNGGAY